MTKRKLFIWTAAAGGYIGLGMVLGYVIIGESNTTPAWVGGVLMLLGAVLLGMSVSTQEEGSNSRGSKEVPPVPD